MKKIINLQLIYVSLLLAISFSSFAQVGIGTDTPDASAALDVTSFTKGFLPPRLSLAEINKILPAAEGLMVYCTNCNSKGLFVYDGTVFKNIVNGESMNDGKGKSMNGLDTTTEVVDIISLTGKTWMDRNLGASQVATGTNDVESYGDLYQWGRVKDGHEKRDSDTTNILARNEHVGHAKFIISSSTIFNWTNFADVDTLWQSGLNDPCPVGYRIPTAQEFLAEMDHIEGGAAGAFNNVLKLPTSANRNAHSGDISGHDTGNYWSSSFGKMASNLYPEINFGRHLYFNSLNTDIIDGNRATGLSLRCIKTDD